MKMSKEKISITFNIEEILELWPELEEDELMAAVIDHINNDSQPTMVFDRMLLMGPVKILEIEKKPGYIRHFKAEVDYIPSRVNLNKFELHAIVAGFDDEKGKKTIYINSPGVYGRK